MNSDFDPIKSETFVGVARERQLLDEDQATELLEQSRERGVMPSRLAIDLDMMMPVEVEIVEAFLKPNDLAPGFELLDVLGYGALGVVYRARQPHLHRDVAIKAILQSRLSQQNVAARFEQEGALIGRLQHPNIVSAFDFGSHRESLYLVMELVNGADLSKRLDSGPMPIQTGLSIIRQAAAGLANAHSHDIIHRDIKPGNLLLTEAPTGFDLPEGVPLVKIADFGLARFNRNASIDEQDTRLTMTGAALGTPMYCAPEQLSGDDIDHRADIYALGATFFRILTGEPPFSSERVSKIIAAKVTGQDPRLDLLPSDLSAEVRELLLDMMQPNVEQRIPDYEQLLKRIDGASRSLGANPAAGSPRTLVDAEETLSGTDGSAGQQTLLNESPVSEKGPSDKQAANVPSKRWLRLALPLMVIVGLAIVGFAAPRLFRRTPTVSMVPTGWESSLFDGRTITGWTVRRGGWNTAAGKEGGLVLVGNNGAALTRLPEMPPVKEGAESGFGFRVGVNLLEAVEAEIQFAFALDEGLQGERYVLSIQQDGVRLGRKADSNAELKPVTDFLPVPKQSRPDRIYLDLRVERHGDDWFAFVDAQQVGTVPAKAGQSDSDIILTANGTVHFDGPLVYQLGEPAVTEK